MKDKIDKLRELKALEEKIKINENLSKKKFDQQLGSKNSASEVQAMLQGMNGLKSKDFFTSLNQKGKSITFDYNGIPIVQKPIKRIKDTESVDFIVSKQAYVSQNHSASFSKSKKLNSTLGDNERMINKSIGF